MQSRLFSRILALCCTLVFVALIPPLTMGATPEVSINLDTSGVDIETPLATAVTDLVAEHAHDVLPGTLFRVTSVETEDDWALLGVVSLDGVPVDPKAPGAGSLSKLVVAHRQSDGTWQATIDGASDFDQLAADTPADLLDTESKEILGVDVALSETSASKPTVQMQAAAPDNRSDNGDLIIDNLESTFTWVGQFSAATCGYANHTNWTYASSETDNVTNDVIGTWRPNIPQTGQYRVLAHIPSCTTVTALTTNARYEIGHAGGKANVTINQNTQRGWVDLGTFNFNAGTNGYTRLTDLTSEHYNEKRAIMFDAVQWVSVTQSPPSTTPTPTATPMPSATPSITPTPAPPTPTPKPTPPPIVSTVNYKFPWPAGQTWGWWQGWHNRAHDLGTSSTDRRVLSAAAGTVTSVYQCTLSTIVDIKHADGEVFRYIHMGRDTINPKYVRVGKAVPQGLVLGELKPDTWQDGNCGYTNQTQGWSHIHWVVPTDRVLNIDGWSIWSPVNEWVKNGVTKLPGYSTSSRFVSTNEPIPSFHRRVFVPSVEAAVKTTVLEYP